MGDPLSVSASVAGLLSLALQTTQYLYQYYAEYRDRNEYISKTKDRLSDLLQTLRIIDDVIRTRTWQLNESHILRHVETSITRCEDVIDELQDEVRKYQKEPDSTLKGRIKEIGRRAAYPFRESTLKKLDEDISHLRDNLSTVIQALELKGHGYIQDTVQDVKHIVQHAQAHNLTASLRDWLRAPDASVDFNAAYAKRHPGTGQWLIQSAAFTTWLEQDNSFRWLYGFAGCGKSVLCATTIQHTFRRQQSQAGSAVAFFFFTFTDESKQDASALLRTLLSQLSGQVNGLEADLTQLRESYKGATPPVPVLMEHLRQAVTRAQQVYILLDALDESPIQHLRADVLTLLETMRRWSLPGLHLLVTSRDEPDIRDRLQSLSHDQDKDCIVLRNESVQEDIRQYVSYQVDHDPQLRRWGIRREKIKEYLTQHADGVFRWVECQLDPLRHCPQSGKYLERCLSTLPRSLDATYERMLCSIGDESQEDAQRILSLLCLSARPLSAIEVIEALAVDIDNLECYDSDRKFECANDLYRICPGFIEIVGLKVYDNGDDGDYDDISEDGDNKSETDREGIPNTNVVRIAHFSVQEYLVSDRIKKSSAAGFAVTGYAQHSQISKTCLLYLLHDHFLQLPLTPNLVRQYPLTQYAARYWHYHYRQIDSKSAKHLTERATALMLSNHSLDRWVRLYHPDRNWDTKIYYDTETQNPASSIYYASLLGLDQVLVIILSKSQAQVNARGGEYGNALQAASAGGHEKVVQILLEKGAEVNAQGGYYGNALQAASAGGHEKVVQILLEKGAEVNAQGGEYGNALQAASAGGHEKVVQILLEKGAEVNAQGGYYGNALQAASGGGHEKIVQILLEKGAEVNAQGGEYGNALQAASWHGHEKVVQILLENGAEVNAQGGWYGNALQAASWHGHEKVVQILLENGAEVNAQGGEYGNALQAASWHGHEKVVQILLENGAEVNAQGGEYGNALQAASGVGHEKIVQILLEKGAEVNAQGGYYGNALQAASGVGHEKVVQILLEKGAEVNAQGGRYGNALQAASEGGHEKIVQILLENGAKVNAQGGYYGNALQAASEGGHGKVVQILLEKGAELNA